MLPRKPTQVLPHGQYRGNLQGLATQDQTEKGVGLHKMVLSTWQTTFLLALPERSNPVDLPINRDEPVTQPFQRDWLAFLPDMDHQPMSCNTCVAHIIALPMQGSRFKAPSNYLIQALVLSD